MTRLPCGGIAFLDENRGPSWVCGTCFCVVGSIGMSNYCRDLWDKQSKRGRVERVPHFTVEMCRANPNKVFVFGDNMEGRGFGGQAVIRHERNAVGLPTKWRPGREEADYFTDEDSRNRDVWHAIHEAFEKMRKALAEGRNVVISAAGLGTGRAQLATRAPRLLEKIQATIVALEKLE